VLALKRTLVLLIAVCPLTWTASPAKGADPAATIGLYSGPKNVAGAETFETFLGHPVARALDFLGDEDWNAIANPNWLTDPWAASAWGDRLVLSVPMLPRTGATLETGASGDYDRYFVALAQNLVRHGLTSITIRPGWEFNGGWFRWSARGRPATYAEYFRHIVTAMRSVPGTRFRFDWSASSNTKGPPPEAAYPGDDYVDYVGLDVYDQYWGPQPSNPGSRWTYYEQGVYGLRWHQAFARRHHKRMAFPEWGVLTNINGHGQGDNPTFVSDMYDWIASNDVAYSVYFEYSTPSNQSALLPARFPRARAQFKALFGRATGAQRLRVKATS
jgi:hypothetical protein